MTSEKARSGGGAATSGGTTFQEDVACYLSTLILAESAAEPPCGLPQGVRLSAIVAETPQPIDDLLVRTSVGGALYVQAKTALSLSDDPDSELGKVIGQFVRQRLVGARPIGGATRPLDAARDRFILAVGHGAPATITDSLAGVLAKCRRAADDRGLSELVDSLNEGEKRALAAVRGHIQTSWTALNGNAPTAQDELSLLHLAYVLELDLRVDGAALLRAKDLLRQVVLRDASRVSDAWSALISICRTFGPQRTGGDLAYIRGELQRLDIPIRSVPSFTEDIEVLRKYSADRLAFLRRLSFMELGGQPIKISRDVVGALREFSAADHTAVIGEPGAGKSGCVHDLADHLLSEKADVVLLAADMVALLNWTNSTSALYEQADVNVDGTLAETRMIFVPQTPESFTYDADGNLTADGRWSYTWDAENHLVAMETKTGLPTALPRQRIEFVYDYLGRRSVKRVYKPLVAQPGDPELVQDAGSGGLAARDEGVAAEPGVTPTSWELVSTYKYVWDGWNLLAELNGTDGLFRAYAWGLDLSGSEQGAGGIGGLLFQGLSTSNYAFHCLYDGNGNVTSVLDSAGVRQAGYEYGAFGGAGTGELDATNTFSLANELKTRDTDSSGTAEFTLAYDKVGNQTDDGEDYLYDYDAFGRLVAVRYRISPTKTVAEYRYNGLGFRIGWHYDADASGGGVDAGDPWLYFCYDDAWRIVATFRASDADPKEVFVHHNAGLGGYGNSNYIDSLILRDRDADTKWTQAADEKREERRYYCQNWRADVSAILTDTGAMVEWVKYSAYGVPFALPVGDTDSDGDWDATDFNLIQFWTTGYDVRFDTNLDGTIGAAADITHANSITGGYQTLGRGVLSSSGVSNRMGYAGYGYDPTFEGAGRHLYHVRHRVYDADVGRWTRRDPLGYVDGMSLYEYVRSRPVGRRDPSGLVAQSCNSGGCGSASMGPTCPKTGGPIGPPNGADCVANSTDLASCLQCCEYQNQTMLDCATACFFVYDPTNPSTPGGPPVGNCSLPDDPNLTDAQMCNQYKATCGSNDGGGVICRNGRPVSCVWLPNFKPTTPQPVKDIVEACLRANEDTHHDDIDCGDCPGGSVYRPQYKKGKNKRREECISDIATINCFNRRKSECDNLLEPDRTTCHDMIRFMLNGTCGLAEQHCGVRPSGCP